MSNLSVVLLFVISVNFVEELVSLLDGLIVSNESEVSYGVVNVIKVSWRKVNVEVREILNCVGIDYMLLIEDDK